MDGICNNLSTQIRQEILSTEGKKLRNKVFINLLKLTLLYLNIQVSQCISIQYYALSDWILNIPSLFDDESIAQKLFAGIIWKSIQFIDSVVIQLGMGKKIGKRVSMLIPQMPQAAYAIFELQTDFDYLGAR